METKQNKTGVIYCRVSSKEQVDGTSLETQERFCRDYAQRNNIEVVGVFIDKGESAKTSERKEFLEAIRLCSTKKPGVSFFIVYKLDRFARNQEDHVTIRALLKKYGTDLCSVTEPINDSPIGKALEGMLSVFAEFDNNVRAERTRAGMLARVQQGVWVWRAPIGYFRPTPKSNIVPDPKNAPYIKMAFVEYSKGTHTYKSLAEYLAERGFRTTCGKMPFQQLLERTIKNPAYYGLMKAWGHVQYGSYEPLISEDLFWLCQSNCQKRAMHNTPRVIKNKLFPLRRFVLCSTCQRILTGSFSTGRHGVKYPYYHHTRQDCDSALCVSKEKFEELFVQYLETITPGLRYQNLFKKVVLKNWENNHGELVKQQRIIQKELERLKMERQKIFEFHRTGRYTDEEFLEQREFVNRQLQEKNRILQDSSVEKFDIAIALESCFDFMRDTASFWMNATYSQKVRFQQIIFGDKKVKFTGEKFETTELSTIYQLKQDFDNKKTDLGSLIRRHWNPIVEELKIWQEFDKEMAAPSVESPQIHPPSGVSGDSEKASGAISTPKSSESHP